MPVFHRYVSTNGNCRHLFFAGPCPFDDFELEEEMAFILNDLIPPLKNIWQLLDSDRPDMLFTADIGEMKARRREGWAVLGSFYSTGHRPIYRLNRPGCCNHIYTTSENEKNRLMREGWDFEGVIGHTHV
jgi:hypothetical protein